MCDFIDAERQNYQSSQISNVQQYAVNNLESLRQQNYQGVNNMPEFQQHACNCRGPQDGDPVCPCMMRGVEIVNGRYVKTQDLGPVPSWKLPK